MITWLDLVRLSDAHLAVLDIALVNLACADGLPGNDNIDVGRCLRALDEWAESVREYTEHYWLRFLHTPEDYNDSEAYFCRRTGQNRS
jgi:hypothetical protein